MAAPTVDRFHLLCVCEDYYEDPRVENNLRDQSTQLQQL